MEELTALDKIMTQCFECSSKILLLRMVRCIVVIVRGIL